MLDLSGHGDEHSAGRFRPEDREINGFLEAIVTAIPKSGRADRHGLVPARRVIVRALCSGKRFGDKDPVLRRLWSSAAGKG